MARPPELRLIRGGATNSRPTATSGRDVRRGGVGFDTVRYRFRGELRDVYEGLRARPDVARGPRGEVRRRVDGSARVEAYPDGLVTVEGRLAALLHGEQDHRLLGPGELVEGVEAAAAIAGVHEGDAVVELGRADLTSELHFADGSEGLELLRAAAYVDLPWLKVGTEGGKGRRLETVHWRTVNGRSTVLRLYDKGVETEQAAPGHWLRLERQRRWRKARALDAEVFASSSLRESFVGRELGAIVARVDDVYVCDRWSAIELLRRRRAAGELGARSLELLAGFLAAHGDGLPARTRRRRESRLRELGIALNPNEGAATSFPAGRLLATFAEAWAA